MQRVKRDEPLACINLSSHHTAQNNCMTKIIKTSSNPTVALELCLNEVVSPKKKKKKSNYLRKSASVTDGGILATNILLTFFDGARISSYQKHRRNLCMS